jgi:hypothetical protein
MCERPADMVLRDREASLSLSLAYAQRDGFIGGSFGRAFPYPAARRCDYVVQSADLNLPSARTMPLFIAPPIE